MSKREFKFFTKWILKIGIVVLMATFLIIGFLESTNELWRLFR